MPETWEREVFRATLMERFDSVLYPINLFALLDRLPELGWVVEDRVDDEEGLRVKPPKRGNLRVLIGQEHKTLGVTGNVLSEVVVGYQELLDAARELTDFSPLVTTDYVELRYVGQTKRRNVKPTEALGQWWSRTGYASDLGSRLAELLPSDSTTLAPYGLKFAPAGVDANRSNWTELTLQPVSIAGHVRFHFDLLYRHQDAAVTVGVAESADTAIDLALDEIARSHKPNRVNICDGICCACVEFGATSA